MMEVFNKLSSQEKMFLYAAVAAGVIAFFDLLFYRPVTSRLREIEENIQKANLAIEQDIRFVSYEDKIYAEQEVFKSYQTGEKKTGEEIIAEFLGTVESLAKAAAVNLSKITPADVVAKKGAVYYSANLEADGRLEDMVKFMYEIDKTENLLKIVKVSMEANKAVPDGIKASMKVVKLVIDPKTIGNYEFKGDDLTGPQQIKTEKNEVKTPEALKSEKAADPNMPEAPKGDEGSGPSQGQAGGAGAGAGGSGAGGGAAGGAGGGTGAGGSGGGAAGGAGGGTGAGGGSGAGGSGAGGAGAGTGAGGSGGGAGGGSGTGARGGGGGAAGNARGNITGAGGSASGVGGGGSGRGGSGFGGGGAGGSGNAGGMGGSAEGGVGRSEENDFSLGRENMETEKPEKPMSPAAKRRLEKLQQEAANQTIQIKKPPENKYQQGLEELKSGGRARVESLDSLIARWWNKVTGKEELQPVEDQEPLELEYDEGGGDDRNLWERKISP